MTRLRTIVQACFAAFFAVNAQLAQGHEFWIDPVDPVVDMGETIEANIRVGEMMKGSGMIFNPNSFTFFGTVTPETAIKAEGRMGDRPALQMTAREEGLYIIGYMTTANRLKYAEFKKFEKFAKAHGQDFAIKDHKARGLPDADFTEAYFRCAKALVKVGEGAGEDRKLGFPFELTALNNPYTDDAPVKMLLTYKGKPQANHQVDVFHRTSRSEDATMVSYQTNNVGEVQIPRAPGDFLINAVVIEEPSANVADKLNAVWVSLWASSTYTIE